MRKNLILIAELFLILALLTGCYAPSAEPMETFEPTDAPTAEPTSTPTATPEPTAAPTSTPEPTQPIQSAASEPIFILPDDYAIGDPLPIFAAVRGAYQARLDPQMFTDAEMISDDTHYNGLVYVRDSAFADGGYFSACEDNYQFRRHVDTNTWKTDLRGEIMNLAEFASREDKFAVIEPLSLKKETLSGITLSDARAEFERMLQQTASGAWVLEAALDMDEARIHEVGEAYNADRQRYWNESRGMSYDDAPDFSSLTEADECFYLEYRYLVNRLSAYYEYNWFGAKALISADGIEQIETHVKYLMGDLISTPERLLTPQEIMEILPKEMKKYRFGGTLHSVISLELIYSVQEDDSSPTGYLMVPAWYILYLDKAAAQKGYTCQAVFSAVDGAMLQSMFDEHPGG